MAKSCWLTYALLSICGLSLALSLRLPMKSRINKRESEGNPCSKPDEPFPCKHSNKCIPLHYLCDENDDCPNGYDENPAVCTAAKRPPVDEMEQFLQNEHSWIMKNVFPHQSANEVARALAVSQTVSDYSKHKNLSNDDVKNLCLALDAVQSGREELLEELGMPARSWNTVYYFFNKLIKSGFTC